MLAVGAIMGDDVVVGCVILCAEFDRSATDAIIPFNGVCTLYYDGALLVLGNHIYILTFHVQLHGHLLRCANRVLCLTRVDAGIASHNRSQLK